MQVILDELLKAGKISPEEHKMYAQKMGAPAVITPPVAAPMGGLQRPKSMGQGDNYFPDIHNPEVRAAEKLRAEGMGGVQNPALPAPNAAAGGIKPDSKVVPNPLPSNRSMTRSPGIGMDGQRLSAKEMGEMLGQRMDKKPAPKKSAEKKPKMVASKRK